jgi:signal transduction histidine kinase
MRLADFITEHLELILTAWDDFARTNEPAAMSMTGHALRNHASQMLKAIALDLATAQTREQSIDKSQARSPPGYGVSAATTHGEARLASGFTIEQVLAEYRALRSSVLRLWNDHGGQRGMDTDQEDVLRFNEAIDQALAESVARYASMVKHSQHLFLAILGHDLRNPLSTTVMASSLLMRSDGVDAGHAEVAARIHSSGLRMGRLIDDLVDYTRTHLGSALPISISKANLGLIGRAAVEEMRLSNPGRKIQFIPGADLDGIWDEGRMAQVFSNLLGNALQHGSASEPVSVNVESSGEDVHVRIHNAGKHIEPDAVPAIFDPLVRFADPQRRPPGNETSLGIGLYIARAIIEAHGGTISVLSAPTAGTTFSVRIPRVPPLVPATP